MNFNELNLKQELHRAILKTGYVKATEIQQKAIPVAIDNYDIIAKSHTGIGKTATFVLPILHNLDVNLKKPQAIILLCPTRELATQVLDQVRKYAFFLQGGKCYIIMWRITNKKLNLCFKKSKCGGRNTRTDCRSSSASHFTLK